VTTLRDPAEITSYHAHVYYDPAARGPAEELRLRIGLAFPSAALGRWHDAPVGPHPTAMYQVAFAVGDFPRLVPWLMLNRGELTILVHPNTADEYADHAHHAVWLGDRLRLKLETLRHAPTAP
jgi:DOPA 4,5-dioxygenase